MHGVVRVVGGHCVSFRSELVLVMVYRLTASGSPMGMPLASTQACARKGRSVNPVHHVTDRRDMRHAAAVESDRSRQPCWLRHLRLTEHTALR